MANILFYAEPHPFRDSFTQHSSLAKSYVSLAKHVRDMGHGAFVLANNETADRLVSEDPQSSYFIMRLNRHEELAIREDFSPWTESAIADWVALATRDSQRSPKYEKVLRRVYGGFPFDLIVSWGDNAAVNSLARAVGADVLHLELGPTRAPFPETFYFDPVGTNSLASFRQKMPAEFGGNPPLDFWMAFWAGRDSCDKTPGCYDFPFMLAGAHQQLGINGDTKVCYIPLQLADDLNTQVGSNFDSPLGFLQSVLPRVVAAGYTAVVKAHPYAHTRPFNLISEGEAIRYAKTFGDQVIVVEGDARPQLGTWLLRNADVVLTINSSVGFEAAIFGTPVVLAGEAAYDGLGFPVLDQRPFNAVIDEIDRSKINNVVEAMLGQILYPKQLFGTRKFARALIDSQVERRGKDVAARVRSRLGSPVDYMLDWEPGSDDVGYGVLPSNPSAFINRKVLQLGSRMLFGDLAMTIDPMAFDAAIEKIAERDGAYLITGWAHEHRARVPPLIVLLSNGQRIVGSGSVSDKREHLARKNKGSALSGFTIASDIEPNDELSLLLVSSDLRCQSIPVRPGRYR